MISITQGPEKVIYPNKFQPGDIAISKKLIRFPNGKFHDVGQRITVSKETEAYFNVCHEDYDKG